MKAIPLGLFLFAVPFGLSGQITFEQEYNQIDAGLRGPVVVQLAPNEHKYLVANYVAGNFSLYNLDHSLFMADISGPGPLYQEPHYYQPIHVSRSLFDCDPTNIEFAIGKTSPVGATFWIVRTDGTILFEEPGTLPYCIGCAVGTRIDQGVYNTEEGTKMMLMAWDGIPGERRFRVFSLCGELAHGMSEFPVIEEALVFPNPSDGGLTIVLPSSALAQIYHLDIMDAEGRAVHSSSFSGKSMSFNAPTMGLPSGSYTSLVSGSDRTYYARFVIVH